MLFLIKKVASVLKEESFIEDEKGIGIKFGDFTNSSRINFLLNFVDDSLDIGDTFTFDEITNIENIFRFRSGRKITERF